MKNTTENNRPAGDYSSPRLEIIYVAVERGFANSLDTTDDVYDWDDGGKESVYM